MTRRLLAESLGTAVLVYVGSGTAGAFIVEVLTTVFVYVILAVTSKRGTAATSGPVIGLTHLGPSRRDPDRRHLGQPARSLGPAGILGGLALHQVWLHIVAPLLGGALAAVPSMTQGSVARGNGGVLVEAR